MVLVANDATVKRNVLPAEVKKHLRAGDRRAERLPCIYLR